MKRASYSKARQTGKPRLVPYRPGKEVALFSLSGTYGTQNLTWVSFNGDTNPSGNRAAFMKCRKWVKDNGYVCNLVKLKAAFYDFGFRLVPKDKSNKQVKDWLDENRIDIDTFRESLWSDWIGLDNAIPFWSDATTLKAIVLQPERCRYSDTMGLQELWYQHDLTPEQIAMLDPDIQIRYKNNPEIRIGYDKGPDGKWDVKRDDEHFWVVKRSPPGHGFGRPSLMSVCQALATCESLEVGESALAFAMRTVFRQHKIGYEIKSGPYAGQSYQHYKKKRADKIKSDLEGVQGLRDVVTNFDHSIEYPWPDAKLFAVSKYDTVLQRLAQWAGPLGWMITTKTANQFLMPMLKAEAHRERSKVGPYLENVINEAFSPPGEVKVRWSDRCFYDTRVASDMLKFFTQLGAASLTSGLEEVGFDPGQERENKLEEMRAEEANKGLFKPIFDVAHGERPPLKGAGRPSGTQDPPSV